MELLRRVSCFNPLLEDLKVTYFLFVRNVFEQSATVWHSSLTQENSEVIERVQKSAMKLILGNQYIEYKESLGKVDMDPKNKKRKKLFEFCIEIQEKC